MNFSEMYVSELIHVREVARADRDWKLSDEIRDYLDTKHTFIFDTKDGQNIYPSQRELAYRAGVSLKTVNHALQLAEKEGWIIRRLTDRPRGRGYKSHTYTLAVPGYVADYAIGRHNFWLPKYTERLVIEDDRAIIVERYPQG